MAEKKDRSAGAQAGTQWRWTTNAVLKTQHSFMETAQPSFGYTLDFRFCHFVVVNRDLWNLTKLQGILTSTSVQTSLCKRFTCNSHLIQGSRITNTCLPALWSILGRVIWQYLLRPAVPFLMWPLPCWFLDSKHSNEWLFSRQSGISRKDMLLWG